MRNLNLEAIGKEQEIIKQYLEENASETLADKINNGVKIIKDNKTLLNKKNLTLFMKYACDEAKKQAEKGANYACIEDKTVFGWAIHYFEEDEIVGQLYNEDGTEYKPKIVKPETPKQEPKVELKKPNPQASFFDMFSTEKVQNEVKNDEILQKPEEKQIKYEKDPLFDDEDNPIENNYKIDKKTGEVLGKIEPQNQANKYFEILNKLLDNKLINKE